MRLGLKLDTQMVALINTVHHARRQPVFRAIRLSKLDALRANGKKHILAADGPGSG